MKKTLITIAAVTLLGFAGIAGATTPADQAAAQSASSVTAFSGSGGGFSVSAAINRQSASLDAGTSNGGAVTLLNQSVGSAGVSGGVKTSTFSAAGNLSGGAGTGSASASGVSTAAQAREANYSTANQVSGTVKANAEGISTSAADAGRNGAALVNASTGSNFLASADSSRTGLFTTTRTANTGAAATANTSTPVNLTWGSGSTGLLNESAANASATAKSGTVTSTN